MSRVGRSSPPVTAGPDRWPPPASAGTESGLQADSTNREGPFEGPLTAYSRFRPSLRFEVFAFTHRGKAADREDDMAQTTWNDPEMRRSILESLSALSADRSPSRGKALLAGIAMAVALVIGINVL